VVSDLKPTDGQRRRWTWIGIAGAVIMFGSVGSCLTYDTGIDPGLPRWLTPGVSMALAIAGLGMLVAGAIGRARSK
jgi:hypothetical protein